MNKKKSEDKPKEEAMPFTSAIQKKIFATLLFDKKALEDIHNLKTRYFENPILRDMTNLIINFFKKYSKMPEVDEFSEELGSFMENKGKHLPASEKEYLDTFDEILSLKSTHLKYSKDLFLKFIRFQAFKEAILESGQKLLGRFDFEGIVKKVDEAASTGSEGIAEMVTKDLSKIPKAAELLDKDEQGFGRLPKGGITMIAGKGGVGKGAYSMGGIGAPITIGGSFMGTKLEEGYLFLINEEDLDPTALNRIINNKGNIQKFEWLELPKDSDGYSPSFNLKHHIPMLRRKLMQYPKEIITNSLLLVDSLDDFTGMTKGIDAYNSIEARAVLKPLKRLAKEFNMVVVITANVSKDSNSELIRTILNSKAFTDVCRAVYAIIADEEEKDRRYFLPLKWNTPEIKNTGIEFELEEGTDKITTVKELPAEDVAALAAERQPGQSRSLGAREKARLFLEEKLKVRGEKPKVLVKIAEESLVCCRDTLYKEMRSLKLKGLTDSIEDGFGNVVWVWVGSPTGTEESSGDVKEKVGKIREKHQEEKEQK